MSPDACSFPGLRKFVIVSPEGFCGNPNFQDQFGITILMNLRKL